MGWERGVGGGRARLSCEELEGLERSGRWSGVEWGEVVVVVVVVRTGLAGWRERQCGI